MRNVWGFELGLIARPSVIPTALILGTLRQIPFFWRLLGRPFGVMEAISCKKTYPTAPDKYYILRESAEHSIRFGLHRIEGRRLTADDRVAEPKEDCPLAETKSTATHRLPSGADVYASSDGAISEVGNLSDGEPFTGELLQVRIKIGDELGLGCLCSIFIRSLYHLYIENVCGLGAIRAGFSPARKSTFLAITE